MNGRHVLQSHTKVSIITPAYNAERFIGATIESVLGQSMPDWELTIVDDGSLDNTAPIALAYARRDPRIRVVSTPNMGVAAACNRGFSASSPDTPFLIFLDSDDVWEPHALETLITALERESGAAGVYGSGRFMNADGQLFAQGDLEARIRRRMRFGNGQLVSCTLDDPTTLETVVYAATIATTGVCLIRRHQLPEPGVPPFPSDFRCSGDLHLWMRMALKSYFVFTDCVVIRKRCHDHNLTRSEDAVADADLVAIVDVMRLNETTHAHRALIRAAYLAGRRDDIYKAVVVVLSLAMKGRLRSAWWWARQARTPVRSYLRGLMSI
ncbi:MAG TPA: glycosyltransferase family A protein [Vicinamibacterales bacterium]